MLISFFTLIFSAMAGAGALHYCSRVFESKMNTPLALGAGFFVSMAAIVLWLSHSPLSISTSSNIAAGVTVFAAFFAVLRGHDALALQSIKRSLSSLLASRLGMLLLVAASLYLTVVLLNNFNREVFPWDAFTTWMYRAKAWVLTDEAVNFIFTLRWPTAREGDFLINAAGYPISVSAVAAYSASLSGGWSDQAASLPWFFALLASGILIAGLCRVQHAGSLLVPVAASAMLITTPLAHLHGVLAGYADIWVMATSGTGLAGLCIWTQKRDASLLALSIGLLALGCVWKPEAWIWLSLGISLVSLCSLVWRFGAGAILALITILGVLIAMQPIDLGTLGVWGITETAIELGATASVSLRPYNPLPDYLRMTLERPNFLLLTPLYVLALLILLVRNTRQSLVYIMMATALCAIHYVIFGLSAYSQFAEIGTAMNRLLLHSLPVCIVTIAAALPPEWLQKEADSLDTQSISKTSLYGGLLATGALAAALPLLIIAKDSLTPANNQSATVSYGAGELIPVMGNLHETPRGFEFSGDDIPIGVARVPMKRGATTQHRYVATNTWMQTPNTISFYWINSDEQRVHSIPLTVSGASVLDMSDYADYWGKPIKEMGYLVPPMYFSSTRLMSLTLTDSLFDNVPALVNHWRTPEPLSHRLINSLRGHIPAPIALQQWLIVAVTLTIGFAIFLARSRAREHVLRSCLVATMMLWSVGSFAHLSQLYALTGPLLNETGADNDKSVRLYSTQMNDLAERLRSIDQKTGSTIVTIAVDDQGKLDAARLPFMLLPKKAISVSPKRLAKLTESEATTVIVLGGSEQQRASTLKPFDDNRRWRLIETGNSYSLFFVESV
jgi:hypothetical protein